jgi:hypothetical protein
MKVGLVRLTKNLEGALLLFEKKIIHGDVQLVCLRVHGRHREDLYDFLEDKYGIPDMHEFAGVDASAEILEGCQLLHKREALCFTSFNFLCHFFNTFLKSVQGCISLPSSGFLSLNLVWKPGRAWVLPSTMAQLSAR